MSDEPKLKKHGHGYKVVFSDGLPPIYFRTRRLAKKYLKG